MVNCFRVVKLRATVKDQIKCHFALELYLLNISLVLRIYPLIDLSNFEAFKIKQTFVLLRENRCFHALHSAALFSLIYMFEVIFTNAFELEKS